MSPPPTPSGIRGNRGLGHEAQSVHLRQGLQQEDFNVSWGERRSHSRCFPTGGEGPGGLELQFIAWLFSEALCRPTQMPLLEPCQEATGTWKPEAVVPGDGAKRYCQRDSKGFSLPCK